ncbi:MAG: amino acid permease [Bryobacterales bacterium]|nr:amino acid permease [Bryobacterales bacterium]
MADHPPTAGLRRVLGPWAATSIVVGTIIGSGIFLVPKSMITQAGSVPLVFVVWIAGGLLSLFGALSYAELGAAMPEAGGEYAYLREAYGGFWGFLYGWTQTWVSKSGSIAGMATGFFYYLANFRPELDRILWSVPLPIGPGGGPLEIRYGQVLAAAVILCLAVFNSAGVSLGGRLQVVATLAKAGLLAAIIAFGLGSKAGSVANLTSSIPAAGGFAGFFGALVAALWAYDGWNNLSMAASDVVRPQRNLPLALVAGTVATITVYIAANLAYFYVLPASAVAASDRVAAEMMRTIAGPAGAAGVSIAAMVSIFAALNGSILSGARVPFAMAADGRFFRFAARVHPRYGTPNRSTLFLCLWASLLVFSGRYEQLFTYVIFASWIFYGMAAAAVIVLRRKRPEMARPFRTAGYPYVPLLFVIGALGVVATTLIRSPREAIMGLVLIFSGVPFYFYWKRRIMW